jgi:hypothetical protein
MGVAQRLRDAVADSLEAHNLVTGVGKNPFQADVNYGTADLRFDKSRTQVITLNAFGSTDQFVIRCTDPNGVTVTDTDPVIRGTNATATDIQALLRTATGDAALTVSGTTDTGPFTVTFVDKLGYPRLQLVALSGCSGNVTIGTLAYDDPATSLGSGVNFDPEASRGFQKDVPLGYSLRTDGTGQSDETELAPPTMVSAVGGSGQIVLDTTEVASGGTNAVVLVSIFNLGTKEWSTETQGVALEDADGDLTATGLAAGDYAVFVRTQTAPGRVSRAAAPEFCTVS